MKDTRPRVLFLLKKNLSSGGSTGTGAGLKNSCKFLAQALDNHHLVKDVKVQICVDGNSVDREVTRYRPDLCIIEAFWVTPEKLAEVQKLHPKVVFVVRVHSNIPFLAHEGIAVDWMKKYEAIPGVVVAFNNLNTANDFCGILFMPIYLPNVYEAEFDRLRPTKGVIDIGCFGAIRGFKNQLNQAVAAIKYANKTGNIIRFHINATRVEQSSIGVVKNLRALFEGTRHSLVEHSWMTHENFTDVIKKMDIGLQVSFTESFNIISADFIYSGVPMVVSPEVSWMNSQAKVSPTSAAQIANKIEKVLQRKAAYLKKAQGSLKRYNASAISVWKDFLN